MLLVLGNHQESRESPSHRGICTEKRGEFRGRSLFGKFSPVLRVELRASGRQESGWQFPPKFEVGSWGLTFGSFSALWNQSFPERVSQGSALSYPVFLISPCQGCPTDRGSGAGQRGEVSRS